ncbi:MFS general substrate transporter [Exidia glandulosa HHB12029]|uniref:MFS general substrate transporter n=1 Tax=Exidia glandulosa HHB12029 TaxID=1314781 RepID=A0A165QNV5_EXIGL|nr:MFS general substrate transporter [Exidia glandulosa HHB12029]
MAPPAQQELEPLVAQRRETPLPAKQLAILCLVRLAEPIAYTQIFPYVNRMMEHLHVTDDPRQIGFYSGLVESVFAFAQLLFIFQWGKLSDRVGRKPVILCGLCGSALSTMLFGLSNSLPTALAARMLAGGLAGNVAVIQSMVGELTDETNQARAFPLLSLCWNIGCIIGPLLGGALSEPASRYPDVFGHIQFLRDHPLRFFLPCAISCSLTLCSIILGYFSLKETLPSKIREKQRQLDIEPTPAPTYGTIAVPAIDAEAAEPPARPPPSIRSLIVDPVVISVVRTYFMLSMNGTAFDVLFVLLSYTAIIHGGLSRNPVEIGSALAFGGLVAALMQPFAFPWLTKRIKLKTLYPCLLAIYPVTFLLMPFLNTIARDNLVTGTEDKLTAHGVALLWTCIAALLLLVRVAGMCYASNMIFIKHAAPTREALGSTFGVAQTVASISRGISPALSSSLFAVTVEHNLLNGWFVWLVMGLLGSIGVFAATHIKDGVEYRKKQEELAQVDD